MNMFLVFCYQNWSDLSVFEQIVLVISKVLQILCLQPPISKVFSITKTFSLTVAQNNFGNKIRLSFSINVII